MYCYGKNLLEGNHTLQFNAIVQSETLYVDQLQYQASATADIGNAWTEVRSRDGRIKYSPGWETDDDSVRTWTYASGAWLTFDFNGTGVIWGGYTPGNDAVTTGTGQYMIDGQEPRKNFEIPSRSGSWSNQLYFNVTGLKPGPHRLTVFNAGNDTTTALGFAYMYMKNGSGDTPSSKGPSAKVIGGAVGGSLGAVLLAVLAVLAVIWHRRRKRQREQNASSMGGTTMGKAMSITSASTGIKEQHTPGSPSQGPWGQPSSLLSHQPSIISSNGPHSPSTFVTPLAPYQPNTFVTPPTGPNQPTNFAFPPGPNQPTMFVTPSNPNFQRGPSYGAASSGSQPPASFAAASSGWQPPASFAAPPSGLPPPSSFAAAPSGMQPPASFVGAAAGGSQQNVWPASPESPIQHTQDGKPDEADYNPYR
ncbi:hypothetical protein EST38_g6454 [Candolleomyces aberdarensis]|uniref:Transmembrane protein n=1 Tax=Candolleomyces aberdarensis TaxID=2316362 RepID=A0A4Q2DHL0_9AGAR|nr:hypothetical protein EST38_g6454 [Candolleomyces aberdarensis]